MKKLILLALFCALLFGRDNPFTPVISPVESGKVSEVEPLAPFSELKIKLPSSARKIRSVKITFQNIDGSVEAIESGLNNDIDWHYPLTLTHNAKIIESTPPKKEMQSVESAPKELPTMPQNQMSDEPIKPASLKSFEGYDFVAFEISEKTIFIKTKDEKIRDFAITDPTKVVLDLKRKVNFKSKNIETNLPYFSEIAIGNHKDSYRLAIKLDGLYKYKLEKVDNGYKIALK